MKLFSALAACAAFFVSGCSTWQALPSVQNKDSSPREVTMVVASDVAPVVAGLADACEGGMLSSGTVDIIADHGPTLRKTVGTYAASARPCVVVDGRLTSDRSTGDQCYRGSVQRASSALPTVLKDVGLAVGGDLGKQAYLAGILASSLVGANDGGVIEGFKHTDDVPLEKFDSTWAPIQADADRLEACANNPPPALG